MNTPDWLDLLREYIRDGARAWGDLDLDQRCRLAGAYLRNQPGWLAEALSGGHDDIGTASLLEHVDYDLGADPAIYAIGERISTAARVYASQRLEQAIEEEVARVVGYETDDSERVLDDAHRAAEMRREMAP